MPLIGLGTWLSKTNEVGKAIKLALRHGYRHIDCAWVYGNEKEVGTAIKEAIDESRSHLHRRQLFITSKLWNIFHDPKNAPLAIGETLNNLQMDYVDLYLIHWPVSFQYTESHEKFPTDKSGKMIFGDVDFKETWKFMETLKKSGKAKNIGLSNFSIEQIKAIWEIAEIKPAVLQIERHPYLPNLELIEFCKGKGIAITAYSPFGNPDNPYTSADVPRPVNDAVIKRIAEEHKVTPGKVCLRYQTQQDIVTIPKSTSENHIIENFDSINFNLTVDDIKELNSLETKTRFCHVTNWNASPNYPFHKSS
ncbi:hypothetical protein SNEBB_002270 [Seison nebaliae]|nr:hypothetical protein SNEBB_002270 [Seison nebaliae]